MFCGLGEKEGTRFKKKKKRKKRNKTHRSSSVARVGGTRGAKPPIGLPTNLQNKKNTTFLALLRLFVFALELTKKWFKASFQTYIQGEGGLIDKN